MWPLAVWIVSAGFAGAEDTKDATRAGDTKGMAVVPQATTGSQASAKAARPLPPAADKMARLNYALDFARTAKQRIEAEIQDYTCSLVKRERVDGMLGGSQGMHVKIRHERKKGDTVTVPFSVFLAFLKPEKLAGREVLFVANQNQGDLIARRGGRRSPNMTIQLPIDSPMAMDGNRYPIVEIGFQNLTMRLIEVLEKEQTFGEGKIDIYPGAKVNGRLCTHFRLTHEQKRPGLTYFQAEVSVDDELGLPILFRSYDWPSKEGDEPLLLEEYFYKDVKLNVGLTDRDFDINNPDYHFQMRDLRNDSDAVAENASAEEANEGEPVPPTASGDAVQKDGTTR
jgi:hypothetical protein